MKDINRFLKRTAFFTVIPAVLFAVLLVFLNFMSAKKLEQYPISENITTAFIGDSHIQQAVNDTLIRNSVNLSQKGESFYFSYYKIERLLASHKQIFRVYLGYSYHSLSSYYEDYIFGQYSKDISPRYFFILPMKDKINLLKHNHDNLPVYFKNVFREALGNIFRKKTRNTIMGYYENNFSLTTIDDPAIKRRIQSQFYLHGLVTPFSEFNIHYFEKIVLLCRKHNIEFILLNTPLHYHYRNRIPDAYVEKYHSLSNKYHIPVIDLHDPMLNDSCYIPDGDHVSAEGAVEVSKTLNSFTYLKGYK